MAGSLTIRITRTDPDESRNISIEPFYSALFMYINGRHTKAQIDSFLGLDATDATQLQTLINQIEAGAATFDTQLARLIHIRTILAIFEMDDVPTAYNTVDKIETELLGVDNYPA